MAVCKALILFYVVFILTLMSVGQMKIFYWLFTLDKSSEVPQSYPLGTMNICTKCHPTLCTKVVDQSKCLDFPHKIRNANLILAVEVEGSTKSVFIV